MLHELLFALNGHPGHVFTQDDSKNFKVNRSLDWFHPAEVGILNKLLELGTCVWGIQAFIKTNRHSCMTSTSKDRKPGAVNEGGLLPGGLYLEALCDGLEAALRPYKLTLADVEKEILRTGAGQNTQLSSIQHKVMSFHPMLRGLSHLVQQFELTKPHGCLILDTVYRASLSGVAGVRQAHQLVLHHCHKVFYKQLLAWVLKGDLHDPYQEFIIDKVTQPSSLAPSAVSEGENADSASSVTTSSVVSSEDSSSRSLIGQLHGGSTSAGVGHDMSSSSRVASAAPSMGAGHSRWRLRADRVPSHISYAIAEKIFFIGESIQLFESDTEGSPVTNSSSTKKDVLKEEEVALYNQLCQLRDETEFRVADFERFVDSVRDTVSRHLHNLILEKSDLKQELNLVVRDVFLLGRGELFQAFIEEADKYLKNPPTAATQHDVNESFAMACRLACPGGADETILRKIKLKVTLKTKLKLNQSKGVKQSQLVTGWDCLSLQYGAPWPLHLILTPSSVESYNDLLKMFLRVRRVQKLLQESWFMDVKKEKRRWRSSGSSGTVTSGSCQLRAHMLFVVNNLQHYLMVDVIESQYSQLLSRLDRSTNFEEIRHAHDLFVNSVVAFTFVRNDTLSQCLTGLLQSCQNYCTGVQRSNEDGVHFKTDEVARDFARQSNLLFKILSTIQGRQTGSQLSQLLLRIDYNNYFSKHGHGLVDCA